MSNVNNTTTQNKIVIELPFSGFYHSIHDMYIDSFIEGEIEYYENEIGLNDEKLDELKNALYDMDYAPIRKAICEHYIKAYNAVFYDEHNIHLDLEFSGMTSPRFYNFETDRLFCSIDENVFNEVIKLLDDEKIQSFLSNKYKSRDGFMVFDSTIEAIENKDYLKFSNDILEMLLDENSVIESYDYTDLINEVISNSAQYNFNDEA